MKEIVGVRFKSVGKIYYFSQAISRQTWETVPSLRLYVA